MEISVICNSNWVSGYRKPSYPFIYWILNASKLSKWIKEEHATWVITLFVQAFWIQMKNQNCGTWLVRFKFIDKFQILKHVESIVMKYADSLLKSILQVARYIADPLPNDIPDKFTAEVIRKRKSILRRVKGYSLSDNIICAGLLDQIQNQIHQKNSLWFSKRWLRISM